MRSRLPCRLKMKKWLVINADDYGYCRQRNRAILEMLNFDGEQGMPALTSVSVMVNAEASQEAIMLRRHANTSIGLHFNITEGKPLVANELSGLINEHGFFLGKLGLHDALINKTIKLESVREELDAQIKLFKEIVGKNPVHIDGHQHAHVFPDVREIFASTLEKNGIGWTRIPIEDDIITTPWLTESMKHFFSLVIDDARNAERLFPSHNIRFAKPFLGLKTMGANMTIERLVEQITQAFSSTDREEVMAELMVHPGYKALPGIGGCGEGPDEFALSEEREHELALLSSSAFQLFLKQNDIIPCPFSK